MPQGGLVSGSRACYFKKPLIYPVFVVIIRSIIHYVDPSCRFDEKSKSRTLLSHVGALWRLWRSPSGDTHAHAQRRPSRKNMTSGSAIDQLVVDSLGTLLRSAGDALLQSALYDAEAARDALAARAAEADKALQEHCADPRKTSVRGIKEIVADLTNGGSKVVAHLADARQSKEQDMMASLVVNAVKAVQAAMTEVKEEMMGKQRKQTGDALKKLKATALRESAKRQQEGVAEAASEFCEKEVGYTRKIIDLQEQVIELTVRCEAAEGSVKRAINGADDKASNARSECEALRRQLSAVEDRHRKERAVRLNLEKAYAQRGAEFWRRQPANAQIKPNKSVSEMRREEEDLKERVRLAAAWNEKRQLEELAAINAQRRQADEAVALERRLAEEKRLREVRLHSFSAQVHSVVADILLACLTFASLSLAFCADFG